MPRGLCRREKARHTCLWVQYESLLNFSCSHSTRGLVHVLTLQPPATFPLIGALSWQGLFCCLSWAGDWCTTCFLFEVPVQEGAHAWLLPLICLCFNHQLSHAPAYRCCSIPVLILGLPPSLSSERLHWHWSCWVSEWVVPTRPKEVGVEPSASI